MNNFNKIPVIFLIDVEPDLHFIDRTQPLPWRGYEIGFEYLKRMRQRLEMVTGSPVNYSWGFRMDPQIVDTYGRADWALTHYSDNFQDLTRHQDAIGLHVHGYRWDAAQNEWIVDHGNDAWMEHCIRSSIDAFKKTVGKPCDFFRFGECWMGNAAMNLLDDLGVPIDLSLEPGYEGANSFHPDKPFTGFIPDQRHVPQVPYQPSHEDFSQPTSGKSLGIWEMPLTTVRLRPRFKIWKNSSHVSLNLYRPASQIVRAMGAALDEQRGYLSMVVRPDVFLNKKNVRNMDMIFDGLCRHPLASKFRFVSPAEALKMIKRNKNPG